MQLSDKKNSERKKVIAVIQVRIGSTRLPRKAIRKIFGKTLVEWIAYRLSFSREIDGVVLSTANTRENDVLALHAKEISIPCYRGSESDLISRLLNTAEKFNADAIVRVTGDCPLVDPALLDRLVADYRKNSTTVDFLSTMHPPTFPDGLDLEILPMRTLRRLDSEVTDPLYREWLTTTILENLSRFNTRHLTHSPNISHMRFTVDYEEDMRFVAEIFRHLHTDGRVFTLTDILSLVKEKSELLAINEMRVDKSPVVKNVKNAAFYALKIEHGRKVWQKKVKQENRTRP